MSSARRNFAPIDFKTRFPALDGLRALAVTMVFIFHYGGGTHGGRLLLIFNSLRLRGWMGVDLFFVLSGFLITGILYDTRNDPRFFKLFFARRSLRIFPVFYLVAVALLLLTPVFGYVWHWGHLPFLVYMGNLSGCADPSLYTVTSSRHPAGSVMLLHLWSLCVEEQFYLLWPMVVWWVRDRTRLIGVASGLAALALGLRIWLIMRPENLEEWITHILPTRMDTLAFGAILALLLRGPGAGRYQRVCKWMFLFCGLCVTAIFVASPAPDSPWLRSIGYTCIAAASAGLIGSTLRTGSAAFRLFHLRPLRIFGKYSYGFYIYHMLWFIGWVRLSQVVGGRLHSTVLGTTLVMATNALVTFLVAKLSYDLFEVRFLRLKTHFEYDSEVAEHRYAFTTE
jgi:peptidoglycan/LPS O-acetylase OafA/YrhL